MNVRHFPEVFTKISKMRLLFDDLITVIHHHIPLLFLNQDIIMKHQVSANQTEKTLYDY